MAKVQMLSGLTSSGVETDIELLLSREEFNLVERALSYAAEFARQNGYVDDASEFATLTLDVVRQVNQIICLLS